MSSSRAQGDCPSVTPVQGLSGRLIRPSTQGGTSARRSSSEGGTPCGAVLAGGTDKDRIVGFLANWRIAIWRPQKTSPRRSVAQQRAPTPRSVGGSAGGGGVICRRRGEPGDALVPVLRGKARIHLSGGDAQTLPLVTLRTRRGVWGGGAVRACARRRFLRQGNPPRQRYPGTGDERMLCADPH